MHESDLVVQIAFTYMPPILFEFGPGIERLWSCLHGMSSENSQGLFGIGSWYACKCRSHRSFWWLRIRHWHTVLIQVKDMRSCSPWAHESQHCPNGLLERKSAWGTLATVHHVLCQHFQFSTLRLHSMLRMTREEQSKKPGKVGQGIVARDWHFEGLRTSTPCLGNGDPTLQSKVFCCRDEDPSESFDWTRERAWKSLYQIYGAINVGQSRQTGLFD